MTALVFAKLSWKLSKDAISQNRAPGPETPEYRTNGRAPAIQDKDAGPPSTSQPSVPDDGEDNLRSKFAPFNPFSVLGEQK